MNAFDELNDSHIRMLRYVLYLLHQSIYNLLVFIDIMFEMFNIYFYWYTQTTWFVNYFRRSARWRLGTSNAESPLEIYAVNDRRHLCG